MTIRHLIDSTDTIYPLTIISRNDLIQHMKKEVPRMDEREKARARRRRRRRERQMKK